MPIILALAVCCAVPLLVGGFLALSGRKKKETPQLDKPRPVQIEPDR